MNYNAKKFTKEEFLALPIYPHARGVPANTDFLLGEEVEMERDGKVGKFTAGKMAGQKDALLNILEEITKSNVEQLVESDFYKTKVNVKYWRKVRDGYVQERGGHLVVKDIVDSMKKLILTPNTVLDLTPNTPKSPNVSYALTPIPEITLNNSFTLSVV